MDVVRALFLNNRMAMGDFLGMLDISWYCNDSVGQIDAVIIFFKVVSRVLAMYSLNYLAGSNQRNIVAQMSLQRCRLAGTSAASFNRNQVAGHVQRQAAVGFSSSCFGSGSQMLRVESASIMSRKNWQQTTIRAMQVSFHQSVLFSQPIFFAIFPLDSWMSAPSRP